MGADRLDLSPAGAESCTSHTILMKQVKNNILCRTRGQIFCDCHFQGVIQIKKTLLVTHLQHMPAFHNDEGSAWAGPRSPVQKRAHVSADYRTQRIPLMRLLSIGTKLLLTVITKHLKMTPLMSHRGGESTGVHLWILLRLIYPGHPWVQRSERASSGAGCYSGGGVH